MALQRLRGVQLRVPNIKAPSFFKTPAVGLDKDPGAIKAAQVPPYLGVANQKVVVRLLDFPRMSPEDLKSAIGFEAQDQIPMPIDEAVLDYVVLGPQGEESDLDRILIVAAQQDMISRYSSAVPAAGLRTEGPVVKALSLLRSTLPLNIFDDEGAILLLDIGAEITSLVVSQSGTPT